MIRTDVFQLIHIYYHVNPLHENTHSFMGHFVRLTSHGDLHLYVFDTVLRNMDRVVYSQLPTIYVHLNQNHNQSVMKTTNRMAQRHACLNRGCVGKAANHISNRGIEVPYIYEHNHSTFTYKYLHISWPHFSLNKFQFKINK